MALKAAGTGPVSFLSVVFLGNAAVWWSDRIQRLTAGEKNLTFCLTFLVSVRFLGEIFKLLSFKKHQTPLEKQLSAPNSSLCPKNSHVVLHILTIHIDL